MKKRCGARRPTWLTVLLLLAAVALYLFDGKEASTPVSAPAGEGKLLVHMIDVGQGDSILLECGDEAMLIDGGPTDAGGRVADYVQARGIDTLSTVVATHPHEDHIGGLSAVLDAVPAQRLLMPDRDAYTACFERLLDAADRRGLAPTLACAGQEYTLGEATVTVLSPGEGAEYEDTNDWSVVLLVRFGGQTALLTGDAEALVEGEILSALPEKIDLLKVGHHGSSTSSTKAFLRRISPTHAGISLGAGNDYGHPHREVVERLVACGAQIWRTDEYGDIVFVFENGGISVQTERTGAGDVGA